MPTPLPGYQTTYDTVKEGSGATVNKGATVTVHATGIVKETGKKFWYVILPFSHKKMTYNVLVTPPPHQQPPPA
jgi:hypothetical protein